MWLYHLLSSIGFKQSTPTVFYEENQGSIAHSKNLKSHHRTKHIDITFHFVRETLEKKQVDLVYCSTENMLADIFTKPLLKLRFEH